MTPYLETLRFQSGGLRLHDLHRQQRAAARTDRHGDQGQQPGGGFGAERQPQLRGAHHPLVRANYLASPPLVVAYALAGRMDFDMANESLGNDKTGKPVYLRDIWPTPQEVEATMRSVGDQRDVPQGIRRSFHGRRALAQRCRCRKAISTRGTTNPPTSSDPPFFDEHAAEARSA